MSRTRLHFLPLFAAALLGAASDRALAAFANFEGKQTAPLRLAADGTRLFAVNTPDARLSVFDLSDPSNPTLIAEVPVGIEPVSVNPLNNDEVWVVNEVSDNISIVSVSRHLVIDTLPAKDEPADLVFAGGKAIVSMSGNNEVRVFDVSSHGLLASIPLRGEQPRALALRPDGAKVYVAFALSGNRTTLVPAGLAPPQPPPTSITNDPPTTGLIIDAADPNWSSVVTYTVADNDIAEIDTATYGVTRYFTGLGTIHLGLAVQPNTGSLFVANTEARNRVRFEPNLRGHMVDNRITRVNVGNGAVLPYDLNPGIDYAVLPNPQARATALAQPTAIVFDPNGGFLYVAAFGSDRVARVSPQGVVLSRIEVGPVGGSGIDSRNKRGPRGLALHAAARRLYVLNRIANTISVIDTATDTLIRELPVGSYDPTPANVRTGRGFLYDARLSGNGTVSCASCHVDADMDHLAWDLGNPDGQMLEVRTSAFVHEMHPMKGPMMTQTLRGLLNSVPLHWRGDRFDFIAFNTAFDTLMGGSILSNSDLTAFREFVNSILFAPNPNQQLDRTLPATVAGGDPTAGRAVFMAPVLDNSLGCITCHRANPGTGSEPEILPASVLNEPQPFKVAHLRNIYQKQAFNNAAGAASIAGFGLTHDGAEPSVMSFLNRHNFQTSPFDETTKSNLNAFVLCFDTGMAPAVGYARTLSAANINSAGVLIDWQLLEAQAAVTNIDLIAKGTIDGKLRGLLYLPGTAMYRSDQTGVGPFSGAQLQARILAGDMLTLMGVPPGSGPRMGIDRNEDGVLDGDAPSPKLRVVYAGGNLIIAWPTNAAAFALESTARLAPTNWSPQASFRGVVGSEFVVTNTIGPGNRFFRLKGL